MDSEKQVAVTIVNKNYPPQAGITGESANELALFLQQKGIKVYIVHTDANYSGGGQSAPPVGELITVKGIYDGKNKLIRLFTSFTESFRLINTARKKGKGLLIIMTDPPFLIFWSAVLLRKRKWAYWSMDLYPDAFVASGIVKAGNFFYRKFRDLVTAHPPSFIIALGQRQLEYLQAQYHSTIPAVTLPCGICSEIEGTSRPSWRHDDNKIYFGYCGNLGEAHSMEFIISVMQAIKATDHVMILAVYGSKSEAVLDMAKNNPAIIIQKSVLREHLKWIDIHLVTLLPEWNHVCVPSKAFSAVCMGGAILFCGSFNNDNWYYLKECGWLIDESKNTAEEVINFFSHLQRSDIIVKKQTSKLISQRLNDLQADSFKRIAEYSEYVSI